MSVVTGIMLIIGAGDWDGTSLPEVQRWLIDRTGQQLREVADETGGSKHPQFEAWGAGINYFLDVDEFADFVLSREWFSPENMVLILQPEDGPTRVLTQRTRFGTPIVQTVAIGEMLAREN